MNKHVIFHIEGGIGKNIVATSVVRAIKNTYSDRKIIVVCPHPDIFLHNPNIYRLFKLGNCPYFYEDYILDKDAIVVKHEPYNSDEVINRKTNLSLAWCNSNNLTYSGHLPEIHFNKIEQENSQILFNKINNNKPVIALQTNGGAGNSPDNLLGFNWYRDVPVNYVQQVVDKFKDMFTFVQIRHPGQPLLKDVISPELSLREMLLLINKCHGALCIDSFLQHAMAAFNKRSVVLWVGNAPQVYGYVNNINIVSNYAHQVHNLESYLEPYPLQTRGHQCPMNYDPHNLFDVDELLKSFNKLFLP